MARDRRPGMPLNTWEMEENGKMENNGKKWKKWLGTVGQACLYYLYTYLGLAPPRPSYETPLWIALEPHMQCYDSPCWQLAIVGK